MYFYVLKTYGLSVGFVLIFRLVFYKRCVKCGICHPCIRYTEYNTYKCLKNVLLFFYPPFVVLPFFLDLCIKCFLYVYFVYSFIKNFSIFNLVILNLVVIL